MRIHGDTDELLRELRSPDPAERLYALSALGMADGSVVDEALIAALNDPDRDCRAAAARTLGERRTESAVSALIASLLDRSQDISHEAAEALGRIGSPAAVEPLLTVLREYPAAARAAAARALGLLRDPAAVAGLSAALNDTTEAVRAEAAEALGELAAEASIPALVDALGDPSDRVRQSALVALRRLGPRAMDALLAELQSSDSDRRRRAAWALGECRASAAVEPLARALQDASEHVRAQASLALGSLGATEAVPALQRALGDPSAAVREAAALSLSRLTHASGSAMPPAQPSAPAYPEGAQEREPQSAGPQVVRRAEAVGRIARAHLLDRAVLLFAFSVLLLVAIVLLGEVLRARHGGVPIVSPTIKGGQQTGTTTPQTPSVEVSGPAPAKTAGETAGQRSLPARADCQITTRAWFVEGDSLVVRGQVVNSGTGVARNVTVRVTVVNEYDEVIAQEESLVTPAQIPAGHSGEFRISLPLPPLSVKPKVKAQVRWD